MNEVMSFFFVTREVDFRPEFSETKGKYARILGTFMELDKASTNGNIYRFSEGEKIAKSLIGKPIRYGANWLGKHLKKGPKIGFVESAMVVGKKIRGVVRITAPHLIEALKAGTKFMFSVGGVAKTFNLIKRGKEVFTQLIGAVCTHLQLLDNNPEKAGFKSAKMLKLLEINESVLNTGTIMICEDDSCRILKGVAAEFGECSEEKFRKIEDNIIRKAVVDDIAVIVEKIMREPWLFFEL